jgi:hypothetical protein
VFDVAARRNPHKPDPDCQDRGLDGDQRGQGGALRALCGRGQTDHRESCGGERHADPLTSSEMKSEESLREHGEEHEPAGQDRLNARERRERQRFDVQAPGEQGENPSDREPARAKQIDGAAQRMTYLDWARERRPPGLEQRAQVGAQRTSQRKGQSQDHREARRLLAGRSGVIPTYGG